MASAYGHRARALALFGLYVHRSHTGQHLQDALLWLVCYEAATVLLMMIMLDKCSKMTFWDTLHSLPPGPLLHVRGVRHELSRHGHLVGDRPYSGPPCPACRAGSRSASALLRERPRCAAAVALLALHDEYRVQYGLTPSDGRCRTDLSSWVTLCIWLRCRAAPLGPSRSTHWYWPSGCWLCIRALVWATRGRPHSLAGPRCCS